MKDFLGEQKTNISQHNWSLEYNPESHTANFVNEHGELMDLSTLGYCLEALRNEAYDLKEKKYGSQRTTPLDDLSKRRQGIIEYNLISDRVMATRGILEAYGDINGVFAIDQFKVYENRRIEIEDSPLYLLYPEAKELMKSLQEYIERVKDFYEDK